MAWMIGNLIIGKFNCPKCNCKLEVTGYSFPYPQFRCPSCIRKNRKKK